MAKKVKIKKTLVEQILTKAGIDHTGIQINALEGELPSEYDRTHIFKTLALLGDKTGPIIGIVPITEHLAEKKLAKVSGRNWCRCNPHHFFKINGPRLEQLPLPCVSLYYWNCAIKHPLDFDSKCWKC